MRKLCLLFVCAAAHVLATTTPVQISDKLASAVWGYAISGSLTICNPAMVEPDGTSVPSGCQTVPVTNGAIGVALLPTAGATVNGVAGAANYSVTYSIGNHSNVQELWAVPVTGSVLTISKVVIPAPGELRPPFGNSLPTTCKQGDLFLNTTDNNLYLCSDGSNDWAQLATGAQAHAMYLQVPSTNGIVYSSGAGVTRNATASDVTTTLGYNPMNAANNLSEITSPAAGRTNLGILDAATHAATDFVLSSAVGSSIATLTAGKVPASQLPAISTLSGQIPLSQVQTTGTPTGTTALFGDGAWKAIPYSAITGTPTIPTDLAGFTNSPGYALSSSISTVGHSGAYSDLTGAPSFGTAATHNLADFVLTSQIGINSGVAPLDASGHLALSLLPTIPSTQISGLGTAATTNANTYLTVASLGTNNGPIQADGTGKLPSADLPSIAYSSLTGTPTIPTDLAGFTNGPGYAKTSNLAAVALSGSYTDLSNKPSLAFDASGAAAAVQAGDLQKANNLSDVANIATTKTNLGLASVASSGAYGDLAGRPTLATVATTGAYSDLSGKPTIPSAYTLPAATATTLGGVICGANTTCATDGTISVGSPYVLPNASNSVLGGIILGNGLLSNSTTHAVSVDTSLFDAAGAATAAGAGKLVAANNLSDVTSVSTTKTNLGLSTVASTGAYSDLTGKPSIPAAYTLPAATGTTLGGIITGANLTVANDGTLSAPAPYTLPQATNSALGGVVVGGGLLMNNTTHALSVDASQFDAAGAATAAAAGTLKAANNLSDVVSASTARTNLGISTVGNTGSYADLTNKPTIPAAYTLTAASSTTLGGVKCGTNTTCAVDGTISVPNSYSLPQATTSVLGGIIVGDALLMNNTTGALAVDRTQFDAAGAATTAGSGKLVAANNLSDVTSISTTKTNLGLAPVASSGAYGDLTGKPTIPTAYTLPVATATTLGGVIAGANLTVANDGTLSAAAPYTLPYASTTVNGGIILGSGLLTSNTTHVVSVDSSLFDAAGAATAASAGKLIAANNLSDVTSISTTKTNLGLSTVATTGNYSDLAGKPTIPAAYTLTAASNTVLGGIKCGTNTTCAVDGTLSVANPYTLTPATTSALGGIVVGDALLINSTTNALAVDRTQFDAAGAATTAGSGKLIAANNLSDVTSVSTARTNLGISVVGNTGSYTDLTNKPTIPSAYTLPPASSTVLGGVKCSGNIACATDGTISEVVGPYTLPIATVSTLGGVVVGSNLAINSTTGALSVNAAAFDAAGAATTAAAGKLAASANLSDLASVATAKTNLGLAAVASSGNYSDLAGTPTIPAAYTLPAASSTVLGGVKCGTNVTCAVDGTISGTATYTLPAATASTLGGIIAGTTLIMNSGTSVLNVNSSLYDAAGAATTAVAGRLVAANNLSDLTSVSTAKTNLGLATVATSGAYSDITGTPVLGTAATHAATDFLATTALGTANGPASLDGTGHLAAAQLPTSIASTVITGLGTASTHPATDFVLASAVGAASGIATLNSSSVLTASQLPAIAYGSLTGAPTLATVATSGSYADLTNKPTGFAPTGTASGDLGGTYPSPTVTGINGQNLVALGAGILKISGTGVPSLASGSDIRTSIGYTPLNAANNLSDVVSPATSRTNLGLGTMATQNTGGYLADTGSTGIVVRGATAGATQIAGPGDITGALGFTPINGTTIGAANGLATLDGTSHLTAAQLPAVPYTDVTGVPSFVLSSAVGVTVAPLVSGLVPLADLPAQPAATTTTLGEVIVGSNLLVTTGGTLSVNAAAFDAAGSATTAAAGTLKASNNLSDLASVSVAKTNLALATLATSGAWGDITGKPTFATVATSGSYADLSNKPTISTLTSQLTNDVPFLTSTSLPVATATAQGIMQPGNFLTVTGGVVSVLTGSTSTTVAVGNDPRITGAVQSSLLGAANGIAQLDATGHLPSAQLPSSINASQISGLGTIATHNVADFLATTLLGAVSGVAGLDSTSHVPLAQLPTIPYTQISGGPSAYVLPAATTSTLGGIEAGTGLTVTSGGVLAVSFGSGLGQALAGNLLGAAGGVAQLDSGGHISTSQLPIAGPATAGIMQVGAGLSATGGSVSVNFGTGAGQALSASLINTANGIDGLDSSGKIIVTNLPTGIPAVNIGPGTVNDTQFGYLAGTTSNIQNQINTLASSVAATATDPAVANFVSALGSAATTPVNIVYVGDSTGVCSLQDCGVGPTYGTNVAPSLLASYAQGIYGSHGTGIVPITSTGGAAPNTYTATPRYLWTVSTGTSTATVAGIGPGATTPYNGYTTVAMTGSSTASLSGVGTKVIVYGATYSDSAACSVSIDGVSQTGFGGSTSGSYTAITASYTVTAGSHTLTLTGPSSGHCYVYGAEWINGTGGVSVHNLARGSFAANAYGSSTSTELPWLSSIQGGIQLLIVQIGTNDAANAGSETQTQYQSYIQNIINAVRAVSSTASVLVVQPWQTTYSASSTHLTDANMNTALNNIVGANTGVAFLNMYARWGTYSTAVGNGLINSDNTHESDAGGRDFASAIEAKVIPGAAQNGGSNSGGSGSGSGGSTYTLLTQPTGKMLLLGGTGASLTPTVLDLGQTYSSTSGQSPKLLLWRTGSDPSTPSSTTYYAGIGMSSQSSVPQVDHISYSYANANWFAQDVWYAGAPASGTTPPPEIFRINPNLGTGTFPVISTPGVMISKSFIMTSYPAFCNSTTANNGQMFYTHTTGVSDVMQACLQDASGAYSLQPLTDQAVIGPDPGLSNGTTAIKAASTTLANVVVIGDSTNVCSQQDCVLGPNSGLNVAPSLLQTFLQSRYGNHGSGIIPLASQGHPNIRYLWTTSGTFSESNNFGPYQTIGYTGSSTLSCGSGCTATLAPQQATSFKVYGATNSDSQACTINIDGTSAGTFGGTTTGSLTVATQTFTTTSGLHTLSIQFPSSGNCYVYGVEAINGTTGISVHNISHGGFTSQSYGGDVNTDMAYVSQISGTIPLAIIDLGINDLRGGVSFNSTTYQTNIQNIVTKLKAINSNVSILLVNPWITNNTSSGNNANLTAAQVKTALNNIVGANTNTAIYDMTQRQGWAGGYAAAQTAGLITSDGAHETDAGGQDLALVYEQEIIGVSNSSSLSLASSSGNVAAGDLNVSATDSLSATISSSSTAYTGLFVKNSTSAQSWGITTSGSSAPLSGAMTVLDQTNNYTPLGLQTFNGGGFYDMILSPRTNLGWSQNDGSPLTNPSLNLDPYLNNKGPNTSPFGGRMYLISQYSNGATLGFYSPGISTSHEWAMGNQASGVFIVRDNSATSTPFELNPISGTGINTNWALQLQNTEIIGWSGGTAGQIGTQDTWIGRNTTGLAYVAGTGVTGGTIVTRPFSGTMPTSSTSNTCSVGQVTASTSYIYYCDATNHFVRAAVASF